MNRLYIDESGSMTTNYAEHNPYFVIAMVKTDDPKRMRKVFKRYVSGHEKELRAIDLEHKLFLNEKFRELKGNQFTPDMKKEFVRYFCRNQLFELYYVVVKNKSLSSTTLYNNTARAFNYLIRISLATFIKSGLMDASGFDLQLDERNERTDTKRFLQDYLNTELLLNGVTSAESRVTYYDSEDNALIQVADVFANIMFSNLMTGNYADEIKMMNEEGYLRKTFVFP